MDRKLELLRQVPLFSDLNSRDLSELGALVDEVDVPSGKVLCQEGRPGDEFFVIVDGAVRVEREGRELAQLGPGQFLGEVALIDEGPRTATATTTTNGRLLVIGHREFHSLMDRYPSIETCVLRSLAKRVRQLDPDSAY
jgi:CRP/FNR family transcriptional regulator, cyclic AMP receptor protein